VVVGTPTFLRPYLRRGTAEDFASLEWAVVGAEKCPADLVDAFATQLETPMLEGYGITETSPVLSVNVPDRADPEAPGGVWVGNVRGSVGRPVVGIAVRFLDPTTGEVLPSGQVGLLEIRGANVFMGYLDAEQTAKAMTPDGWYRTGDLADSTTMASCISPGVSLVSPRSAARWCRMAPSRKRSARSWG
jgi:acyl-[acyl-carrier-protein]-phospholipid O-acyltransferase/long-chain-fatty-acid--[acyl-carrier-protein] ligase